MADAVFLLGAHFGEGEAGFFGRKHGVVAEAVGASGLCDDIAFDDALKETFAFALNQTDDRAEAGAPVRLALEALQQQPDVGTAVVAVAVTVDGGETCGVDAGLSAESVHFKPRVVGKTVHAVVLMHVAGFLAGVALKGVARFGNVFVTTYVGEPFHDELFSQNLTNLAQLAH